MERPRDQMRGFAFAPIEIEWSDQIERAVKSCSFALQEQLPSNGGRQICIGGARPGLLRVTLAPCTARGSGEVNSVHPNLVSWVA